MKKMNNREVEVLAESIFTKLNKEIELKHAAKMEAEKPARKAAAKKILKELKSISEAALEYAYDLHGSYNRSSVKGILDLEKIEKSLLTSPKTLSYHAKVEIQHLIILNQIESKSLMEITDAVLKDMKPKIP